MTTINGRDCEPEWPATRHTNEARPIAKLLQQDGKSVVGWVYLWESKVLSILWISEDQRAYFIDPLLTAEMLPAAAKTMGKRTIEFLETLPSIE
ncbi:MULTISPECIES: hypothetical protein [Pseudosulfitobacter]|uniref:hypothetical protein n=1 Tax=Pseudosulfitobacter pseudonitzschiae TaxID=1402135 RepID=UPI0011610533|nr:hypothetical protein [Pseudosulfitobacter pseudonitzschiae]QKS10978.1 hypothetical protein HT745_20500 [Pseudosulfitobacter pseudonitzschiae]